MIRKVGYQLLLVIFLCFLLAIGYHTNLLPLSLGAIKWYLYFGAFIVLVIQELYSFICLYRCHRTINSEPAPLLVAIQFILNCDSAVFLIVLPAILIAIKIAELIALLISPPPDFTAKDKLRQRELILISIALGVASIPIIQLQL